MIGRAIFAAVATLSVCACSDRSSNLVGKVDDWTWEDTELKTRTSPSKEKRARADVEDGNIDLKFGEAGDHPADIMIHYAESIPRPQNHEWDMKWIDDERFVFVHSDLGTKVWTIQGVTSMTVTESADWHHVTHD